MLWRKRKLKAKMFPRLELLAISLQEFLGVLLNYDNVTRCLLQVRFRLVMFRPFVGEVIIARLIASNKDGLRCMTSSLVTFFLHFSWVDYYYSYYQFHHDQFSEAPLIFSMFFWTCNSNLLNKHLFTRKYTFLFLLCWNSLFWFPLLSQSNADCSVNQSGIVLFSWEIIYGGK